MFEKPDALSSLKKDEREITSIKKMGVDAKSVEKILSKEKDLPKVLSKDLKPVESKSFVNKDIDWAQYPEFDDSIIPALLDVFVYNDLIVESLTLHERGDLVEDAYKKFSVINNYLYSVWVRKGIPGDHERKEFEKYIVNVHRERNGEELLPDDEIVDMRLSPSDEEIKRFQSLSKEEQEKILQDIQDLPKMALAIGKAPDGADILKRTGTTRVKDITAFLAKKDSELPEDPPKTPADIHIDENSLSDMFYHYIEAGFPETLKTSVYDQLLREAKTEGTVINDFLKMSWEYNELRSLDVPEKYTKAFFERVNYLCSVEPAVQRNVDRLMKQHEVHLQNVVDDLQAQFDPDDPQFDFAKIYPSVKIPEHEEVVKEFQDESPVKALDAEAFERYLSKPGVMERAIEKIEEYRKRTSVGKVSEVRIDSVLSPGFNELRDPDREYPESTMSVEQVRIPDKGTFVSAIPSVSISIKDGNMDSREVLRDVESDMENVRDVSKRPNTVIGYRGRPPLKDL